MRLETQEITCFKDIRSFIKTKASVIFIFMSVNRSFLKASVN
jgi:hypothetical protein